MEGIKGMSHGPDPILEGGVINPVDPYNMFVLQRGNVIGSIKNLRTEHVCVIN
jgi:hypothetical protein